ncbi:hypothetical protein MTO96_004813 [Rhipicephalus appendiculatus]
MEAYQTWVGVIADVVTCTSFLGSLSMSWRVWRHRNSSDVEFFPIAATTVCLQAWILYGIANCDSHVKGGQRFRFRPDDHQCRHAPHLLYLYMAWLSPGGDTRDCEHCLASAAHEVPGSYSGSLRVDRQRVAALPRHQEEPAAGDRRHDIDHLRTVDGIWRTHRELVADGEQRDRFSGLPCRTCRGSVDAVCTRC